MANTACVDHTIRGPRRPAHFLADARLIGGHRVDLGIVNDWDIAVVIDDGGERGIQWNLSRLANGLY